MTESSEGAASTDEYIKTTTHNFVSKNAVIEGAKQVGIQGRSIVHSGVKFHGNVGIIRIGRYVWIESKTELEPAPLVHGAVTEKRVPMMIGNHTRIGQNCHIQAAAIGSMVILGDNVKIGQRCIIKDCCIIDSNVILGDDTVVPPFTRISYDGTNTFTLKMQELPPSMTVDLQEQAMDNYDAFANRQRTR